MRLVSFCLASAWLILHSTCKAAQRASELPSVLRISVAMYERKVLMAEPAFLTVTFHNSGKEGLVLFNPVMGGESANTHLFYHRGEQVADITPSTREFFISEQSPLLLGSGQSRFMWVDLAYAKLPREAGDYLMRVTYSARFDSYSRAALDDIRKAGDTFWLGTASSNENTLTIEQPSGKELEAFIMLTANTKTLPFQEPEFLFSSESAQKVLLSYPRSRYARYCLYYSGLRLLFQDPKTAIKYLQRFIKENPEHPLADNAQYAIADNFEDRGLLIEAEAELTKFMTSYPQSELAPSALRLRNLIARRKGSQE